MSRPRVGIGLALTAEDHNFTAAPAYRFEYLKQQYYESLEREGLLCFGLPASERMELAAEYADTISGLFLTGGEDINPTLYQAEFDSRTHALPPRRDNFELALLRECSARGMPIFGICRGMQLLNIARGGSLWQDLRDCPGAADHTQQGELDFSARHEVKIVADTRLHRILGVERIETNTGHHQGVDRLGAGLTVAARASDGVVEALEGEAFTLAVQWHPEAWSADDVSRRLFAAFADAVRVYAAQRTK